MKILAISKLPPGITKEDLLHHQAAEAAQVWELYKSGVLREIYLQTEKLGAVLILECTGIEEAKVVLGTLPMVKAGALDFEIIPLAPFLSLEKLFSK